MNLINNKFSDRFSFQIALQRRVFCYIDSMNKMQFHFEIINNYEADILVYVSHLIHHYGKRENTTNFKFSWN